MIVHILISIGFYLILMYLSINLLGFLVRGLFSNPELDKLKQESSEFIKNEVTKSQRADLWINIIASLLIIIFFYILFHFWNIGVVASAIIIMIGRFPDLLWEIKHGKKMTYDNTKSLQKNALYYISAFLPWLALPVLFYSLYYF